MRHVAASRGVLTEGRREYDGADSRTQIMVSGEPAGEFVILPAGDDELHLVARAKPLQILQVEGAALAGVWALHIHNLNYLRRNPLQWPLAAGFQQDRIPGAQQAIHQGDGLALLQHWLAACD